MTVPFNTLPPLPGIDDVPPHVGAVLTVDLDAICDNYRLLLGQGGAAACAAVVKADAYGLGAERVAQALAAAGCRHFFVAHIEEGIALRRHLPAHDIFVLHGAPAGAEQAMAAHRLTPVLNSLEQISAWTALARLSGAALPAVIQVDTGMSRLGLAPEELAILAHDPHRLDGIELRYVMSHLACAEDQANPANARQLELFRAARRMLPPAPASFANSSGIFLGADYHFDLLRPGAALYGIAPVVGAPNPLRPVLRLQGKVLQTRTIPPGTPVGYSGRFVASSACRIATVSVGYADGFLRSLGNKALAAFDGVALPVVGAVSMDTITIDASALPEGRLTAGAWVDLIGGSAESPDAIAARAGSIAYEILTSLGARYHRRHVGGRSDAVSTL